MYGVPTMLNQPRHVALCTSAYIIAVSCQSEIPNDASTQMLALEVLRQRGQLVRPLNDFVQSYRHSRKARTDNLESFLLFSLYAPLPTDCLKMIYSHLPTDLETLFHDFHCFQGPAYRMRNYETVPKPSCF